MQLISDDSLTELVASKLDPVTLDMPPDQTSAWALAQVSLPGGCAEVTETVTFPHWPKE